MIYRIDGWNTNIVGSDFLDLIGICGVMRIFCVVLSIYLTIFIKHTCMNLKYEPWHGISNNVVCATSKASDQPAHTHSLIRAFASRLSIL